MVDNITATTFPNGSVFCEHPGSSEFVDLSVSNFTQGAEATYSCYRKYHLISGNLSRFCLSDGSWSGHVPYCSRNKPVSETTIAFITGALAVLVLILLPFDYVLSKRRIRRQKLWERRATKKRRNERVAAFNMIAIKHAGNLSRPPLVLMQARDISLNPIPIPEKLFPYTDNAQENAAAERSEYQKHISFVDDTNMTEETEAHKETGFIENGNLVSPCGNPRVLPPLERKPSKRQKKKKRRKITPQSSVDADDGGFLNAGYTNCNPNLDHIGQDVYANELYDNQTLKRPPEGGTEYQHRADVHRENDYQTVLGSETTRNHADEIPYQNGTHDSIALQVGYNGLGNLATDV